MFSINKNKPHETNKVNNKLHNIVNNKVNNKVNNEINNKENFKSCKPLVERHKNCKIL